MQVLKDLLAARDEAAIDELYFGQDYRWIIDLDWKAGGWDVAETVNLVIAEDGAETTEAGQEGFEFKGRTFQLEVEPDESHLMDALRGVNRILSPDYECRYLISSHGTDSVGLAVLPTEAWTEIDASYPLASKENFIKLDEIGDLLEIRDSDLPDEARARFERMVERCAAEQPASKPPARKPKKNDTEYAIDHPLVVGFGMVAIALLAAAVGTLVGWLFGSYWIGIAVGAVIFLVLGIPPSKDKGLPETEQSLVLRTDFSDDAAWETICREIKAPQTDEQFRAMVDCVSDQSFAKVTPEKLVGQETPYHFIFIVDSETVTSREHLILVLDLQDQPGRSFRVIPSEMWSVENNLSLGNMDFGEFAGSVDDNGVFRGFPD